MRPAVLIPLLLFAKCACLFAQKNAPHWEPENIDSLKNLLHNARDTARINLLNEISFAYFNIQMDSSKACAQEAYREATAINYTTGKAVSLSYLGQWELTAGDHKKAKDLAKQAYETAKKGDDKKCFAATCNLLGYLSPKDEGLHLVDKADSIFKSLHDVDGQLDGYAIKGIFYLRDKQTYEALKIYNRYASLSKESGNVEGYANGLQLIARIYGIIGDYATANTYYQQATRFREQNQHRFFGNYDEMSDNYMQLKKYDSALYAINKFISNKEKVIKDSGLKAKALQPAFVKKGNAFVKLGLYDSALHVLLPLLDEFNRKKKDPQIARVLPMIGEAYAGKKEFGKALQAGQAAMRLASALKIQAFQKAAAALLATAYRGLNQADSAYAYLQLSTTLNDSLTARNVQNNLTFYKTVNENEAAESKIELLGKDNQLKQQRLNIIIGSFLGVLLLSAFFFRLLTLRRKHEATRRTLAENELQIQKLESEKKQAALQQHAAELEMQALRAQMNPHFIFNCLNAINHFVLKAQTETACDYLTKFSRLIRMVLQNSAQKAIPLEDELTTLRLYMELEQLRFKKPFRFSMAASSEVDLESSAIPPLLLQPFVENAIWHGLMHKDGEGLLTIEITQEADTLSCTITDNGTGRESSAVNSLLNPEKKSMGMQITAARLKFLEQKGNGGFFDVIDLKDAVNKPCGTKVLIKIPVVAPEAVTV